MYSKVRLGIVSFLILALLAHGPLGATRAEAGYAGGECGECLAIALGVTALVITGGILARRHVKNKSAPAADSTGTSGFAPGVDPDPHEGELARASEGLAASADLPSVRVEPMLRLRHREITFGVTVGF